MTRQKKRIAVIGLGQFGRSLALTLATTCEVLVVDIDQSKINDIADEVELAIRADAREFANLAALINEDVDEVVVSIGESLEASILCVLHLKNLGVRVIHAKALTEDHGRILESLGADNVIFPETETARRLARRIHHPGLFELADLAEDMSVLRMIPMSSEYGKKLSELHWREKFGLFVVSVRKQASDELIVIPGPEYKIQPEDELVLLGTFESIEKFRQLMD